MKRRPFGQTGVALPIIGQGTWDLPESGRDASAARRAICRGIELGMTHIDTAEMYGSGRVEELLGDALSGLPRDRYFITTKVLPSKASYRGALEAAERSIARLRCGHLDLYLLHWPGEHPLEETMQAFDELVTAGKVRFVGVSNFEANEMLEAASYLRTTSLACNQVLYHLCERAVENELIPIASERGIAIVGYTPFGRGRFLRSGTSHRQLLERIAAANGATVRQIALAFLTRTANVFVIPKAAKVQHVEENAGAGELQLNQNDLDAIDAAFPRGPAGPLATL